MRCHDYICWAGELVSCPATVARLEVYQSELFPRLYFVVPTGYWTHTRSLFETVSRSLAVLARPTGAR